LHDRHCYNEKDREGSGGREHLEHDVSSGTNGATVFWLFRSMMSIHIALTESVFYDPWYALNSKARADNLLGLFSSYTFFT
jgi:hypothetical protein